MSGASVGWRGTLVVLCLAAAPALAGPWNLGEASNYTVLGLDNVPVTVSSGNTVVEGNFGLSVQDSLDFSGGGHINGTLFADPSASYNITGGSVVSGGLVTQSMSQAASDALAANVWGASQSPSTTFASIGNGTGTISGGTGLNVFKVTGDVNVSGGAPLTLSGGADSYLLFNVYGAWTFSGGSNLVLTGGLTPSNILWNFVGAGGEVNFNGNSDLYGTFLAPDRDVTVSGGTVTGQVIGGGNFLKLQSGPKVYGCPPPPPPPPPVPEPSSLALLGVGALALLRRAKPRSR